MIDDIKKDATTRMAKTIDTLKHDLTKMRTGRAHTSLLDHITVENYGSQVPLNQVASISAPEPRLLVLQLWDKSLVGKVEKAIQTSDLGLNPATAGTTIRVPLPPLTEERRREMVKVVRHEGENTKVAIRNIRRDANSMLKDLLKDKDITEDQERHAEADIQKLTDQYVAKIDKLLAEKEAELMEV